MAQTWQRLQQLARRISAEYPDAVLIGGIAIAQYAKRANPALEEASHDLDLYLSLAGKNELRDRYEVIRNQRLGKDSAIIDGEDVDLYIERQHRLAIPYDEIIAYAQDIDGIRVAALEHLLVLKLDAAQDRRASAKGDKDVRDLTRILTLLTAPRAELLRGHLDASRQRLLTDLARRREAFERMGIDPHAASRLRRVFDANLAKLVRRRGPGRNGLSR